MLTLRYAAYSNIKAKVENISMVVRNVRLFIVSLTHSLSTSLSTNQLVEMCEGCAFRTEQFEETINKINIVIQKSLNETLNRSQLNATLNSSDVCRTHNQAPVSQFMIELNNAVYRRHADRTAFRYESIATATI